MDDKKRYRIYQISTVFSIALFLSMGIIGGLLLSKGAILQAVIAFLIALGVVPFYRKQKQIYDEVKQGIPIVDERTDKVRMNAAGNAFHISLYMWLGIMFIQTFITKSEMLIIAGILGMSGIYGLSWLYQNSKEL
jgi:uncharacterized membrane protein